MGHKKARPDRAAESGHIPAPRRKSSRRISNQGKHAFSFKNGLGQARVAVCFFNMARGGDWYRLDF